MASKRSEYRTQRSSLVHALRSSSNEYRVALHAPNHKLNRAIPNPSTREIKKTSPTMKNASSCSHIRAIWATTSGSKYLVLDSFWCEGPAKTSQNLKKTGIGQIALLLLCSGTAINVQRFRAPTLKSCQANICRRAQETIPWLW